MKPNNKPKISSDKIRLEEKRNDAKTLGQKQLVKLYDLLLKRLCRKI